MMEFIELNNKFDIQELKKFNEFSESNLNERHTKVFKKIDNITKNMSDEEKTNYSCTHDYMWWSVEVTFPNLMRKSNFITYFAYTEHQITLICDEIQKKLKIDDSIHDYTKGNSIYNAKKYLENKCKIEVPFGVESWKQLEKYRKLRNAIVHEYGSASSFERLKIDFTKTISGINKVEGIGNDSYEYTIEFNRKFLNFIEEILLSLLNLY